MQLQMERKDRRPDDDSMKNSQPTPNPSAEERRPLIVGSEELMQGRRELWIEHGDEMYRLRVTSSGKLYLTK